MPLAQIAHRPANAEVLAAQVKDIDAEKLQTSISKVLEHRLPGVLAATSGDHFQAMAGSVEYGLVEKFNLDLSLVARLGGHSVA